MSDYRIADCKDSRALTEFLQKEGQFLLPIVSLIETAQAAIDEVIDVAGRPGAVKLQALMLYSVSAQRKQVPVAFAALRAFRPKLHVFFRR